MGTKASLGKTLVCGAIGTPSMWVTPHFMRGQGSKAKVWPSDHGQFKGVESVLDVKMTYEHVGPLLNFQLGQSGA
eukprot:13825944-Heterocapsa_arctica.AAC.1